MNKPIITIDYYYLSGRTVSFVGRSYQSNRLIVGKIDVIQALKLYHRGTKFIPKQELELMAKELAKENN